MSADPLALDEPKLSKKLDELDDDAVPMPYLVVNDGALVVSNGASAWWTELPRASLPDILRFERLR